MSNLLVRGFARAALADQSLKGALAAAFWLALAAGPAFADDRVDELDPGVQASRIATDVAAWVIASGDAQDLPFAIIDKHAAQILVFGEDGRLQGMAPVLLGSAIGDRAAPGVADRKLSDIPAADRTTPAGRFFAGYGPAAGGKRVLWVDYASAVSLHPLQESDRSERRQERLASPNPGDNRISHGCINVSAAFYAAVIKKTIKRAGIVYVLPELEPLRAALPGYRRVD